jgi:hypothetical protein
MTTDELIVQFHYSPSTTADEAPEVVIEKPFVEHGTLLDGPRFPLKGKLGEITRPMTYKREKSANFILTMHLGNDACVLIVPPQQAPPAYKKQTVISLAGPLPGFDENVTFAGVGPARGNGDFYKVRSSGFQPRAQVEVQVLVRFLFDGGGGNRVSCAPYLLYADGNYVEGYDMSFISSPPVAETGELASTVSGHIDGDGIVTIGFYIGLAKLLNQDLTLTAAPGSKIIIKEL